MINNDLEIIERLCPEILERINNKPRVAVVGRKKYDQTLPPRYKTYLARANRKGISLDLTLEQFDFICCHDCVYCGTSSKIGVDRIDYSQGYTLENSQPCCGMCNMMKFTHDHETFLRHIKKIYDRAVARYI